MSRILGIRCGADVIRYAVIETVSGTSAWLNCTGEHKWKIPRTADSKPQKLSAAYTEVTRLLAQYKPIHTVAIKVPEYGRMLNTATAMTISMGTVVLLASTKSHVPVEEYLYANLKLNSSTAESYVLGIVSRPSKYWDVKLMDALAVALKRSGA